MPSEAPSWFGTAPGRVNLIGEHVDYMGGVVLPAAIDRYTEVSGSAAAEWNVRSEVTGGLKYVRAVGEELGAGPQSVLVSSDVPPGVGLSSSAALLVATAKGLRPDLDGRAAALACRRAEQRATGVNVGVMDQFACCLGRQGFVLLLDCSTLEYEAVPFPADLVLAVIDSGERRDLASTPYNQRRREAESGDPRRRRHVDSEIRRVHDFVTALRAHDGVAMGALLLASHESLRHDFEVSTPALDELVALAVGTPGCYGARLMGAGFGGSVLALLQADLASAFTAAMPRPVICCRTADGAFVTPVRPA